jgi:hypothetical protein
MFLVLIPIARADLSGYSVQVGALGDASSVGNMGVQVDIQTHSYTAAVGYVNAFWVGDNLNNGAFVQFGYELASPGNYCLSGVQVIGSQPNCNGGNDQIAKSDPRWIWEYWPNSLGDTFYFGTGRTGSVGADGSWHTYSIMPNAASGWSFVLDGQQVGSVAFTPTQSKDPVFIVAEEFSQHPVPSGHLGPVEFRNLEYLKGEEWNSVSGLTAISGCGTSNPDCASSIPYGVSVEGADDILAGAGSQVRQNGDLLWPSQAEIPVWNAYSIFLPVLIAFGVFYFTEARPYFASRNHESKTLQKRNHRIQ